MRAHTKYAIRQSHISSALNAHDNCTHTSTTPHTNGTPPAAIHNVNSPPATGSSSGEASAISRPLALQPADELRQARRSARPVPIVLASLERGGVDISPPTGRPASLAQRPSPPEHARFELRGRATSRATGRRPPRLLCAAAKAPTTRAATPAAAWRRRPTSGRSFSWSWAWSPTTGAWSRLR